MTRFVTQLSGTHVLVTGGNKGIGKVIVESFLAEGANVSYCGRTARGDELNDFADAKDGARAVGTKVDLGHPDEIKAWVEASAKDFERIDAVIANAFSGEQGETDESWQRSFQVDVMGYKKLLEATTPHLARREGLGSIVTISTMAAFEARYPIVGGSYPALKRAQAVLAKDFARKLSALGVRINTVAPAAIETPDAEMPDGAVELSTIHAYMSSAPGVRDKLVGEIPLGRIGRPDEVANVCLFLASPLSSFVHGATLMVDGGATLML